MCSVTILIHSRHIKFTTTPHTSTELVLYISIPFKQNVLRAGKAQLRIRNLGFTITTCDSPPRTQGSWQIIHIRKYGGSDFFKFETGMLKVLLLAYMYVDHFYAYACGALISKIIFLQELMYMYGRHNCTCCT